MTVLRPVPRRLARLDDEVARMREREVVLGSYVGWLAVRVVVIEQEMTEVRAAVAGAVARNDLAELAELVEYWTDRQRNHEADNSRHTGKPT